MLPTDEWRTWIETLTVEADQLVFALSPHSAASEVGAREAQSIALVPSSLGKRN